MRYRVRHATRYDYPSSVSLSHNQARLIPRALEYQFVESSNISISPEPNCQRDWIDSFGNRNCFFTVEQSHYSMDVSAESVVRRQSPCHFEDATSRWGDIAKRLQHPRNRQDIEASQFMFGSQYAFGFPEARHYAEPSFPSGRQLREALLDLTQRIYQDFKYDTLATQVSTPTKTVLQERRGVCQDFAHLQIACLRSLGLAARYVSGYLLTHPAPGQIKLVGSDASHAWLSAYVGDGCWLDLDPTNNMLPSDEHITIGWGRDYADVGPIQGILIGTTQSFLKVNVDVIPI